MQINTTPTQDGGKIPLSNVQLRIKAEPEFYLKEATGGKSLIFKFEIAEPAEVSDVEGNVIAIGGREITDYVQMTGKGVFRFVDFHAALRDAGNADVPVDVEINDETGIPVGIEYTGKLFWATVKTEVQQQKSGTEVMLNPLNGKPMEQMRLVITRFIKNV